MAYLSRKLLAVNIFGTFGYISLVLQWLWVSVLFLPQLFKTELVQDFLLPPMSATSTPQIEIHTPPVIATVIAVVVTLAVLAVTLVVVIRLPQAISKAGKNVTHASAKKIVPTLTHHKKLAPKKRRQLTIQTIKALKLALTLLPFALLALVALVPAALPNGIVIFVGALLAIGTLGWFSIEYGLARLLRVDQTKIV